MINAEAQKHYSPIPFVLLILILFTAIVLLLIMVKNDRPIVMKPVQFEQPENSVYKTNSP